GPLPACRAAGRSAPRRGRGPLPLQRGQHAGAEPGARLARAPLPCVSPESLKALLKKIFIHAGMDETNAGTVIDVLVWAEMRGMGSHGVMRVPRYVELMRKG